MNDYKFTLNLPKTKFSMRGNLSQNEPKILQKWLDDDLYHLIRNAKKGKKIFFLHDGPPYANGKIHIGHSVNKILKDIIVKYKGLSGYDVPYIPGWDCHGLPIEHKIEQKTGIPGKTINIAEFQTICRQYASKQVEDQKNDFIRLGVLGDWSNSYLTMNFNTEANIIRTLSKVISDGYLYRGTKPVHWCINCRSALAEAEVEYYDKVSPAIYVAFKAINPIIICNIFQTTIIKKSISILIWTTTPWTLVANRAISIHPDFIYQLIQIDNDILIIAKKLVNNVFKKLNINKWIILGECKGISLELQKFQHPFINIQSLVILGQHVTSNVGTGIVHTAPAHGLDDYLIGKKYNLEITNLVAADGSYLPGTHPFLDKKNIFDATNIIIDLLKEKKALFYFEEIIHAYPHCWRHKTPLIFCATPQWFINMDKNELRKKSLLAVENVKWIPSWGKERIKSMISNRPDWCISRQRTWGVPMTLFIHNESGLLHPNTINLIEKIAKLIEINGIKIWWDIDPYHIIGDDAMYYSKVLDTLDVWFDSGSTSDSVVNANKEFSQYTSDMYLEGSDQYRGWFISSLMISMAIKNKPPYHQVLTHGFVVDGQGRKMSKSIGNTISPQDIINKLGADILRLWVASTDYSSEMAISNVILEHSIDIYRRIRNTARFILGNLYDFDPYSDLVIREEMLVLDRWIVGRTKIRQEEIISAYEEYNFHEVIQHIMHFCSIEMGSFYLDIIKDRQYTAKYNSLARRSCQTALWHIIQALVRWISPIIPFTADEIWNYLPSHNRSKYVFTEEWYKGLFGLMENDELDNNDWLILIKVRTEVNKIIEKKRNNKYIGSSLESVITLYVVPELAIKLHLLDKELRFLLLTSEVHILDYCLADDKTEKSELIEGLKIKIDKSTGKKCPRCWHHTDDFSEYIEYKEICNRCYLNIVGNGEIRKFT